jgi:hypothetical protein
MKTKLTVAQTIVSILLLLFLGVTFSACKSTPKVDWNSRVGNFTYDQAVAELGPPDKSAKLSDGQTVADWIKHSHGGMSFGVGTGFYGSHSAVGVGYPDKVLRLTFGPDHKLISWSKNY